MARNRLQRGIATLLAAGLAWAAMCAPLDRPKPEPPRNLPISALQASVDSLRGLVTAHQAASAEARARQLLQEAERDHGSESFEVAAILGVLAEAVEAGGTPGSQEAYALASRAANIEAKRLPAGDLRLEPGLSRLGSLCLNAGRFSDALPFLERAQAIQSKALGSSDPRVVKSLDKLGIALRQTGDFRRARQCFEKSYRINKNCPGSDSKETAQSLHYLGVIAQDLGEYAQSKRAYEHALAIRQEVFGPRDVRVAPTLSNLAAIAQVTGDFAAARVRYEEAAQIFLESPTRHLKDDQLQLAATYNNLAILLQATGDYAAAKAYCARSLAIRARVDGPDHPLVAWSLQEQASILNAMGDYAGAARAYRRALQIWLQNVGPEHWEVADCMTGLAELALTTGDPDEARRLSERAVEIRKKALGPDHPDVAASMDWLAQFYVNRGEFPTAIPILREELRIRQKSLPQGHPAIGWSLVDLASALGKCGQRAEASPLFEQGMPILERALGGMSFDVAMSTSVHADFLADGGDAASARRQYERATRILEQCFGADYPLLGQILSKLASVVAEEGDSPTAFEMALRSEAIGLAHLRLTSRTISERGALRYATVRASGLDLALSLAAEPGSAIARAPRRSWAALVRSRAMVLDEMAARNRTVERAGDPEVTRLAAVLAEARKRLADLTVRGPGDMPAATFRALLDQARQSKEEAERTLAEKSAAFRSELAFSRAGTEDVIDALPDGSALVAFARYRRCLPRVKPVGEPSDNIARGQIVPLYLAFVLAPGAREPVLIPLGPAAALEEIVTRWSTEVSSGAERRGRSAQDAEAAYRAVASSLRERIWDPLLPHFGNATRVFVVPDGVLQLVDIAALPARDGNYLVEHPPVIHYLSSERDLLLEATNRVPGRGLLAIGDPDFDARTPFASLAVQGTANPGSPRAQEGDLSRVDAGEFPAEGRTRSAGGRLQSVRFPPLPASKREATAVAQLWKNLGSGPSGTPPLPHALFNDAADCLLLTGAAATETAFKRAAPGRRVLHLATHGFFLGSDTGSAGAGERGIAIVAPRVTASSPEGENPLLLAGLALAGANRRDAAGPYEDDGILTAEEVAGLDLEGVEWAVLSACETGRGEIKAGEGVFGLRRAFQVAGAGTLITSLWSVRDEITQQWMESLYRGRLERGLGTAEAVRAADLDLLRQSRSRRHSGHPFYWAGFVAAGDWR